MKKINLGCGSNKISGWENYDMEVDISKPLPFENNSVDFAFAEHVLEHIPAREGVKFLEEICRVLKPGGVVKIIVPDIVKIYSNRKDPYMESYLKFLHEHKWCDGTLYGAIRSMIFNYGHLSLWTDDLLVTLMSSMGMSAKVTDPFDSEYEELKNVSGHWKTTKALSPWTDGKKINKIDNTSVEGTKNNE